MLSSRMLCMYNCIVVSCMLLEVVHCLVDCAEIIRGVAEELFKNTGRQSLTAIGALQALVESASAHLYVLLASPISKQMKIYS